MGASSVLPRPCDEPTVLAERKHRGKQKGIPCHSAVDIVIFVPREAAGQPKPMLPLVGVALQSCSLYEIGFLNERGLPLSVHPFASFSAWKWSRGEIVSSAYR